jgi:hypothetical protein
MYNLCENEKFHNDIVNAVMSHIEGRHSTAECINHDNQYSTYSRCDSCHPDEIHTDGLMTGIVKHVAPGVVKQIAKSTPQGKAAMLAAKKLKKVAADPAMQKHAHDLMKHMPKKVASRCHGQEIYATSSPWGDRGYTPHNYRNRQFLD